MVSAQSVIVVSFTHSSYFSGKQLCIWQKHNLKNCLNTFSLWKENAVQRFIIQAGPNKNKKTQENKKLYKIY